MSTFTYTLVPLSEVRVLLSPGGCAAVPGRTRERGPTVHSRHLRRLQPQGRNSVNMADFDWPTRVTRVTLTSYPVYAAHAVPRE